ncbi:hypothetical protein EON65_27190 [archaeon]|nr:MAG: hypothetical protein EON65_27190 [archaeon]
MLIRDLQELKYGPEEEFVDWDEPEELCNDGIMKLITLSLFIFCLSLVSSRLVLVASARFVSQFSNPQPPNTSENTAANNSASSNDTIDFLDSSVKAEQLSLSVSQSSSSVSSIETSLIVKPKDRPLFPLPAKLRQILRIMTAISANMALTLKLCTYYFLLYFFTVVYNLANKRLLTSFSYPVSVATFQVFAGIPMFLPIWALKAPKNIWNIDRVRYMNSATCHALGQVATVYALYAGSVSFTHVVKAAEPLFSAILSAVVMKSKLSVESYLSLMPIVVGVAIASMKEFSFSWVSLGAAMASNFFYQLRMVLSKQSLLESDSAKLSAGNAFRVVTLLSFLLLLPLALLVEGNQLVKAITTILQSDSKMQFIQDLLISGASFYLYNEISFWILELVHPVSFAVGNTIKRVVLIGSAILFFKAPIDPIGALGALVAIVGSFLFAMAHQRQASSAAAKS